LKAICLRAHPRARVRAFLSLAYYNYYAATVRFGWLQPNLEIAMGQGKADDLVRAAESGSRERQRLGARRRR
jgi:hypothetical protein